MLADAPGEHKRVDSAKSSYRGADRGDESLHEHVNGELGALVACFGRGQDIAHVGR